MTANQGVASKCAALDTSYVECMAEKVCPAAAEAFKECVVESFSVTKKQWSNTACDKHVEDMRNCLKKARLYPILAPR